jgi:hypothetical protein
MLAERNERLVTGAHSSPGAGVAAALPLGDGEAKVVGRTVTWGLADAESSPPSNGQTMTTADEDDDAFDGD